MDTRIDQWNDDGGSYGSLRPLTGSIAQVEWAERIRLRVSSDFDRVASAFQAIALKQDPAARAATEAVISILEDTKAQVMLNDSAGYFIHDWQEISDQVRRMIFSDPRYQEIKGSGKSNYEQETGKAS